MWTTKPHGGRYERFTAGRETAQALEAHAAKVIEMTRRIEELTDGAPGWYRGMRTRVEARATLWQQVRVLLDTLARLPAASPSDKPAP